MEQANEVINIFLMTISFDVKLHHNLLKNSLFFVTFNTVERIKDISKAEAGDFLSYRGCLAVVLSVEHDMDHFIIQLDNGTKVVEKLTSRLEFFRMLRRTKAR